MRFLIYFVLFLGLVRPALAQKADSVQIARVGVDSLTKSIPEPKGKLRKPLNIVPKYATYRSLALPGWGQAYVRQYWTIPIIYGGFGALGYAIHWNQVRYKQSITAWQSLIDQKVTTVPVTIGDTYYNALNQDQLRQRTSFYRRQRDLSIIGCVVLYAFQLVEANVTAHLKTFDNTDDISFRLKPGVQTDYVSTPMGVTAVFTLK